jgi:hypothetical protein
MTITADTTTKSKSVKAVQPDQREQIRTTAHEIDSKMSELANLLAESRRSNNLKGDNWLAYVGDVVEQDLPLTYSCGHSLTRIVREGADRAFRLLSSVVDVSSLHAVELAHRRAAVEAELAALADEEARRAASA